MPPPLFFSSLCFFAQRNKKHVGLTRVDYSVYLQIQLGRFLPALENLNWWGIEAGTQSLQKNSQKFASNSFAEPGPGEKYEESSSLSMSSECTTTHSLQHFSVCSFDMLELNVTNDFSIP